MAANRIATALSAQQTVAERSAARTLQESLLPTRLPEVDGLEFATRFVAAEDFGVGGDWFDAFKLPDGQIGIVVGDVAGSGLQAAVVMGRLRSVLRAVRVPSRQARAKPSIGSITSSLTSSPTRWPPSCTSPSRPDLDRFTVSTTGHLPPVIALPGQDATFLDCPPSPPIGAHVASRHIDVVCELGPGTTVGCYTDGLIERRVEPIDRGLERLRAAFYAGDVEDVCSSVMADLIGASTVEDDTALLVFRRVA